MLKSSYLREELEGWLFAPELIPPGFFLKRRRRMSREELILALKQEIALAEGDDEKFEYYAQKLHEILCECQGGKGR